jgi:hypothetical protein
MVGLCINVVVLLARWAMRWLLSPMIAAVTLLAAAEEPADAPSRAVEKEQLARVQQLVGGWRGVGQPQRGSTRDNWIEEADWSWQFDRGGAALVGKLPKGRFFRELRLESDDAAEGHYVLTATPADESDAIRYHGQLDGDERLVLEAKEPRDGFPVRMSFRFVAGGDRLLVLLERQGPTGQLVRLAEVGYTRQGSGFGRGTQGRECVVTGGLGTIEVSYEGKTYYVCCTGCRDYFNDNPAEVLAEFAARKAEEARK